LPPVDPSSVEATEGQAGNSGQIGNPPPAIEQPLAIVPNPDQAPAPEVITPPPAETAPASDAGKEAAMNKMFEIFCSLPYFDFFWLVCQCPTSCCQCFKFRCIFPSSPLFNEDDFKPGFVTTKCFQVTNNTEAGVPVGITLANYIDPNNLGGALDVVISQAGTTGNIFTGTLAALNAAGEVTLTSSLPSRTPESYCVNVTFQTAGGNVLQGKTLSFDFSVGIASGGGEPTCGNGQQEAGEQCDLGTANGLCPSACSSACTFK